MVFFGKNAFINVDVNLNGNREKMNVNQNAGNGFKRCQGIKKDGNPCQNKVAQGRRKFCNIHGN